MRASTISARARLVAVASVIAITTALGCSGASSGPDPEASARQAPIPAARAPGASRCNDYEPLGRALFGDVHIHTAWSMDAWVADTRGTPDDAYRFASGGEMAIAGGRRIRLERPLDFAAVSDHAETIGEMALCTSEESPVYDVAACRVFRGDIAVPGGIFGRMMAVSDIVGPPVFVGGMPLYEQTRRSASICGPDAVNCIEASRDVWRREVESAAHWQDRSPECRFTTFPAYEYTLTPRLTKIHRNIIFANDRVPEVLTTATEEPDPGRLFERLAEQCLDAGNGCDLVSIPHNPNLSNGQMFFLDYQQEALAEQRSRAALRARVEPLVEIMQIKGDSECRNGLVGVMGGSDEECDFEKFRPANIEDCLDGKGEGALGGFGCISRRDFVRYALVEGLREEARIGVNPFKFGITASTDTHNGNPGDTEETSYDGARGNADLSAEQRLRQDGSRLSAPLRTNPGGLFGVWAQENSRTSIFGAMKRRETFGTSGTRIQPRLFGGWDYPADLCDSADVVRAGYADGVAMGNDLPARSPGATGSPVFVATALRDPGAAGLAGTRLERIQIIKGWVGDDQHVQQAIYDAVGTQDASGDGVDPNTCEVDGSGHDSLCTVWRDPDFDPTRRAVYYARVLERPSCRWSTRQCLELPGEPLDGCSDPTVPKTIRERAWTSPIWYTPEGA